MHDDSDATLTIRLPAPAAPAAARPIGHFLALAEGNDVRRVPVGPGGLTIGRQAPCDLVIPVAEISRRHCRIDLDGERAMITDLGSTNGTMVSGERIAAPTRLRNGTRIGLGGITLRYERRDVDDVAQEAELATELRRAADYVRAILPPPLAEGPVRADWWFAPSAHLGGDALGYQFLDADTFAGFVLDVSGHGIGASMHAVNVANVLRRRALPDVDFRDPAQVAAGLNAMFPMEEHNGLMMTLWYFVHRVSERRLRFCAAGHHAGFLVPPGAEPAPLWRRGPALGMLPAGVWAAGEAEVPPDSRLYVFSDGAFEIVGPDGRDWSLEDLRRVLAAPERPGVPETQRVYQAVRAAARPGPLPDDVTLLLLRFA